MSVAEILAKLGSTPIKMAQIDPFSYCNAKCWFCPVRYSPNPKEAVLHMPIEVFEQVIADLCAEKGRLVAPDFNFIYTAHYNEVLLYRHFEQMIAVLRKYGIKTYVLSNGVPLTPAKTDLIAQNTDVVVGVCLNVPAFEREIWSRRTGMNEALFDRLIENIGYAEKTLKPLVGNKMLSIQINGSTENSFAERGGWLERGEAFPQDMNLDPLNGELARQHALCKEMFPLANVYPMPSLIDRAGLLHDAKVISNRAAIERKLKKNGTKVVGCGNGREVGGRPLGWLHLNARADAFLCCNDYSFDYVFGNLQTHALRDIWVTDRHAEIIHKSFNEICVNCASSIWV